MPTLGRTLSISSTTSSISSTKSVSFDEIDHVFYTHSSNEYDRSAANKEERYLYATLGRIYLSAPEQAVIKNPQQDGIVERNTFANGRRNSQGYAVVLNIRSARSH